MKATCSVRFGRTGGIVLQGTVLLATCLSNQGCATTAHAGLQPSQTKSFAVYALSRGKGVPDESRIAVERARALLQQAREEKKVLRLVKTPLGLEGEVRWCAEFSSEASARQLYQRVYALIEGMELVNLQFEPCATE